MSNAGFRAENTKQAIIEAAYSLFVEQGYHGASMRDIAARARIAVSGIYNHFTDKEQIFQAVMHKYHPVMRVIPHLNEAKGATAEALIRDAAHRMAKEVEASHGVISLIFIELVDLGGKHIPELAQATLPQLQAFLDKVYRSGKVTRLRDPVTFFSAFIGVMFGYAFAHVYLDGLPGLPRSDRSLEEYIETFLWGVLCDGDTKQ